MIPRMIFIPLMLPVITIKPGRLIFRARQVRLKTVDMDMNDICARCFFYVSFENEYLCFIGENNKHFSYIHINLFLAIRKEREE